MSYSRIKYVLLLGLLLALASIGTASASSFIPPSQITVRMYRLQFPSGAIYQPQELCSSGNTNFGCTAFVSDANHPYPYGSSNPVTIPIETDYLLDVVPSEISVRLSTPQPFRHKPLPPVPMPTGISTRGAPSTTPTSSRSLFPMLLRHFHRQPRLTSLITRTILVPVRTSTTTSESSAAP